MPSFLLLPLFFLLASNNGFKLQESAQYTKKSIFLCTLANKAQCIHKEYQLIFEAFLGPTSTHFMKKKWLEFSHFDTPSEPFRSNIVYEDFFSAHWQYFQSCNWKKILSNLVSLGRFVMVHQISLSIVCVQSQLCQESKKIELENGTFWVPIVLESWNYHQSFLLASSDHPQNFSQIWQLLNFTFSNGLPFAS